MIAKSGSLSLKQPVNVYPIFLHKVFHFVFDGKPREKHTAIHSKCFTVVAHFMFVSTCVTKSSDPILVTSVSLIQKTQLCP